MPRRAHKKSRNGCLECKRRHVKVVPFRSRIFRWKTDSDQCDERRPRCVNCSVCERDCEYRSENALIAPGVRNEDGDQTLRASRRTSSARESPAGSVMVEEPTPVNMLHFELFYHLSTQTIPSLEMEEDTFGIPATELLRTAVSTPYLMNEALAFAALQLAVISSPEKKTLYKNQAEILQTQALSIFNASKPEVNIDTCGGIFLFSAVLGNHLLCDALVFRDPDFNLFMDKLCHSIQLYRGVRVIAGFSSHLLSQTPLKPLIQSGRASSGVGECLSPECQKLVDLIASAQLGQPLTDSYQKAIRCLQLAIDTAKSADSRKKANIAAWPVRVPEEYIMSLMARRPEALVILAHYAILLNGYRGSWLFCDSGSFMIQSISQFIGPGWEEWMAFPNSALDATIPPYISA